MHVNSVSSVKFTFYKKVIRKLETKWLINMTFFGEKILHFRQTLTFIEERRDMRRKLFVDTIFSRIRSIMALIPQFILYKHSDQTDVLGSRVTAGSDMWLWGCEVWWRLNVPDIVESGESPACLNTPWISTFLIFSSYYFSRNGLVSIQGQAQGLKYRHLIWK